MDWVELIKDLYQERIEVLYAYGIIEFGLFELALFAEDSNDLQDQLVFVQAPMFQMNDPVICEQNKHRRKHLSVVDKIYMDVFSSFMQDNGVTPGRLIGGPARRRRRGEIRWWFHIYCDICREEEAADPEYIEIPHQRWNTLIEINTYDVDYIFRFKKFIPRYVAMNTDPIGQ